MHLLKTKYKNQTVTNSLSMNAESSTGEDRREVLFQHYK